MSALAPIIDHRNRARDPRESFHAVQLKLNPTTHREVVLMIAFTTVATESGTLEFRWTGDRGFQATHTAALAVV